MFDEIVQARCPTACTSPRSSRPAATLKFEGVAQSSTRVSAFMRNIDGLAVAAQSGARGGADRAKSSGPGSQLHADARAGRPRPPRMTTRARPRTRSARQAAAARERSNERCLRSCGHSTRATRAAGRCRCWRGAVARRFPGGAARLWDLLLRVERAAPGACSSARTRSSSCAASSATSTPRPSTSTVYKQQLKDIERSFGALLRQLPGKTEVPNLLVDISQTGLAAGLQEKLFQPEAEAEKDFYAELPIKIRLTGSYHQFGEFVSGIAALPRIVTLHDIEITAGQQGRLRPAVARADGEDLPLSGRGRDRGGVRPTRTRTPPSSARPGRTAEPTREPLVAHLCISLPTAYRAALVRLVLRALALRRASLACSSADEELAALHRRTPRRSPVAASSRCRRSSPTRPSCTRLPTCARRSCRAARLRRGTGRLRPDQKRNREFLEQFSLDTLKMVGTLRLGGPIYGLVQTKDGLVHRVDRRQSHRPGRRQDHRHHAFEDQCC